MLLRFLETLVVPKVNYGAFVDVPSSEDDYKQIDRMIAELASIIMDLHPNLEREVEDFLKRPHNAGGKQLLLPGDSFKKMQHVATHPVIKEGFKLYHVEREADLKL